MRNSDFRVELSDQLLNIRSFPCSILSSICYCGVVWSRRVEASQHCTHHLMCQQHNIFQWSSWDDTIGHFNSMYRSFLEVSSDIQLNPHILKWLWRTSITQKKQLLNWKKKSLAVTLTKSLARSRYCGEPAWPLCLVLNALIYLWGRWLSALKEKDKWNVSHWITSYSFTQNAQLRVSW